MRRLLCAAGAALALVAGVATPAYAASKNVTANINKSCATGTMPVNATLEITGIAQANAPTTIQVFTPTSATVPLSHYSSGRSVAFYDVTLTAPITSATAIVPSTWAGTFDVVFLNCQTPPAPSVSVQVGGCDGAQHRDVFVLVTNNYAGADVFNVTFATFAETRLNLGGNASGTVRFVSARPGTYDAAATGNITGKSTVSVTVADCIPRRPSVQPSPTPSKSPSVRPSPSASLSMSPLPMVSVSTDDSWPLPTESPQVVTVAQSKAPAAMNGKGMLSVAFILLGALLFLLGVGTIVLLVVRRNAD